MTNATTDTATTADLTTIAVWAECEAWGPNAGRWFSSSEFHAPGDTAPEGTMYYTGPEDVMTDVVNDHNGYNDDDSARPDRFGYVATAGEAMARAATFVSSHDGVYLSDADGAHLPADPRDEATEACDAWLRHVRAAFTRVTVVNDDTDHAADHSTRYVAVTVEGPETTHGLSFRVRADVNRAGTDTDCQVTELGGPFAEPCGRYSERVPSGHGPGAARRSVAYATKAIADTL